MTYIFDNSTGGTLFTLDDNNAITESGEIVTRVTDNLAVDFETGKPHFFSGWESGDRFDSDCDF